MDGRVSTHPPSLDKIVIYHFQRPTSQYAKTYAVKAEFYVCIRQANEVKKATCMPKKSLSILALIMVSFSPAGLNLNGGPSRSKNDNA